jgi:PAT family beta-lactamase induction signal transducer AmpG
MSNARERRAAPWLFGITILPYGVYNGFITTAMPYLLRNAGLPVDRIADIGALALAPAVWAFLWSPLADVGFRKRTWLIVASALSGACVYAAMRQPLASRLGLFTVLVVAGSVVSMLVSAANGGLMAAAMQDSQRGRAAGWYSAGNVGGAALGAGLTLWLAPHLSVAALAYTVGLTVFLPSLAALAIPEPPAVGAPGKEHMAEMLRDLKVMFRSRTSLVGFAIFLSPMGAAAAANLFSGVAVDYRASSQTVVWINGFGGALLTTLGSLAGGFLCDRISRRLAYALAAILAGLCAAGMMIAPLTQPVFAVGVSLYLITQGLAFSAYYALSLELVGDAGRSAATRYMLYNAAANAPVAYMTWLDGQGYKRFGPRGLLGTDALSNIVSALVFLFLIRRTVRGKDSKIITASKEN